MELRQLRYFVAVAEELHFGRAAARLHMAQSPLSRQIQGLERDLRTVLLRRTTRSVTLTPAGAELLARGRRILQEVDDATRLVRELDSAPARLGFTTCSASALLHRVVRVVQQATGGRPMDLRGDLPTCVQVDGLLAGELDVGFGVLSETPLPTELAQARIATEPLAVVLPRAHRLADRALVTMTELADEPFVAFRRDGSSAERQLFDDACLAAGIRPVVVHEARETATLLGLVAAGLGAAVLPLSGEAAGTGVVTRPLATDVAAHLVMMWRRSERRRLVRAVVDAVARELSLRTVAAMRPPTDVRERPTAVATART